MQSVRSVIGAAVFVASCMCASAASANATHVGHDYSFSGASQRQSSGPSHWWNFFGSRSGWNHHGGGNHGGWWSQSGWGWWHHGHHGPGGGNNGGHHGGHHGGGGGDCKVPEIPTSGLPSMLAVALGGVAIVVSRKARRLSE